LERNGSKIVRKNLLSDKVYKKQKSDLVRRSLIRHDSEKLAKVIYNLI